jgi:hypothetical protein
MLALLTGCATESSSARQFIGLPLKDYPDNVQIDAANKIEKACGKDARCPVDATLEQMTLDYGKLRCIIRATNGEKVTCD